jgi:hypothetical protein
MTAKQASPSSVRNAPHLIEVLGRTLPSQGTVLEIASGSGYHAAAFAAGFPHLSWQPSDADVLAHASIAAYREESQLTNFNPALDLDVMRRPWPIKKAAAMVCINMIHISPWAATVSLFAGASDILEARAPLITYGPYVQKSEVLAESNAAFDQSLKARNPAWGLRNVEDIAAVATEAGFILAEIVPMPANNLSLIWRRV